MALSYFSNWDSMHHFDFSDMNVFPKEELHHHEEEEENLFTFSDVSDIIEHPFNTDDFFLTDDLNSLLCDFSPPPPLPQQPPPPPPPPPPPASSQLSTQILQPFCLEQEYQEPNPKRHKACNYHDNDHIIHCYASNPNLFNDPFLINSSFLDPTFQFGYHVPLRDNTIDNMNIIPMQTPHTLADFPSGPPVYNCGSGNHCETNAKKETSVSSQSISARNRRRKITEKTQELGKLVPGGQRMNTAEMLLSAHKYIKFLQAQVGILEFMGSSSNDDHRLQENEGLLNCLLTSTLIQEKLYSAEKCLVPQTYVEELSKNHELVRSNHELVRKVKVE